MNEIAVHKNLIIANSTYRRWHDVKLEFAMEFTEFVTPEEEYRSRKLKSRQDAAEEAVDELKDRSSTYRCIWLLSHKETC